MLALTREVGQEIIIGDPSNPLGKVKVIRAKGGKARLAFDFPRELQINRSEVAKRVAKEQEHVG